MKCYLDTSLVVSLIVCDSHTTKAVSWYQVSVPVPAISNLVKLEVAATISCQFRTAQLSQLAADHLLGVFDQWAADDMLCVEVTAADMNVAERMVRHFATKLSGPDAIHLAIAARLNDPLVTFDERITAAARMQTIKAIVPADAL